MKILIWDDNETRCGENRDIVNAVAAVLGITVGVQTWTGALEPRERDRISEDVDLLLVHGKNAPKARQWFITKRITGAFILEYSGNGVPEGITRPLLEGDALREPEAEGILEAARETHSQEDFIAKVAEIWSSVPQDVLSWALLAAYGKGNADSEKLQADISASAAKELAEHPKSKNEPLSLETAKSLFEALRDDI